ncbi:hypothetical protein I215_07497, partial [Galbibacter marinus]
MSKLKSTLGIVAIAFITLTVMSCKDNSKEQNSTDGDHSEMNHDNSDGHHDGEKKEMAMSGDGNSQAVLKDYFNLKNALVADDNAKAKTLGATLATTLGNFDVSSNFSDTQKAELKEIIEDAV